MHRAALLSVVVAGAVSVGGVAVWRFLPPAATPLAVRAAPAAAVLHELSAGAPAPDAGDAFAAWARAEPVAAVAWALAQGGERYRWLEAALGAIRWSPDSARAVGARLLASGPEEAAAGGTMLVGTLARAREFAAALDFARAAPAALRAPWQEMIFELWGKAEPEQALHAAAREPALPRESVDALIRGWAGRNPAELAGCADLLPAGSTRALATASALDAWLLRDAAAAASWVHTWPPGAERDAAVARLVTRTDRANRDAATALAWVATIANPALRENARARVFAEALPTPVPADEP